MPTSRYEFQKRPGRGQRRIVALLCLPSHYQRAGSMLRRQAQIRRSLRVVEKQSVPGPTTAGADTRGGRCRKGSSRPSPSPEWLLPPASYWPTPTAGGTTASLSARLQQGCTFWKLPDGETYPVNLLSIHCPQSALSPRIDVSEDKQPVLNLEGDPLASSSPVMPSHLLLSPCSGCLGLDVWQDPSRPLQCEPDGTAVAKAAGGGILGL
ncbi:hypothetical protein G7046_g5464 [Stylonectria norvegica]|nr:hypothetical protein G7046_g5464 [Stylonectria norvegica]